MDAATRAELDALRARAYAPDADIHLDPTAMARLEELQLRAGREEFATGRPAAGEGEPFGEDLDVAPPPAPQYDAPRVRGRRRAVVIGVALAALAAGVAAASVVTGAMAPDDVPEAAASDSPAPSTDFAQRDGYETLIRITIDGSFGSAANLPATEVPYLEPLGDVLWHEPLGDYYGFTLSIAGVRSPLSGEQLCLSTVDPDGDASTVCSPADRWQAEGLLHSIPYVGIAPADRPDGLGPGDALAFWWVPDDAVLVLRGSG